MICEVMFGKESTKATQAQIYLFDREREILTTVGHCFPQREFVPLSNVCLPWMAEEDCFSCTVFLLPHVWMHPTETESVLTRKWTLLETFVGVEDLCLSFVKTTWQHCWKFSSLSNNVKQRSCVRCQVLSIKFWFLVFIYILSLKKNILKMFAFHMTAVKTKGLNDLTTNIWRLRRK